MGPRGYFVQAAYVAEGAFPIPDWRPGDVLAILKADRDLFPIPQRRFKLILKAGSRIHAGRGKVRPMHIGDYGRSWTTRSFDNQTLLSATANAGPSSHGV
jgi:hypothetical protein